MSRKGKRLIAFSVMFAMVLSSVSYSFVNNDKVLADTSGNASANATTEASTTAAKATTAARATTEAPVKSVTPPPTVIKRVMNAGSKRVKVFWIAKGNVDGYQLKVKQGKTTKKVLLKGRNNTNVMLKKLKAKKKYSFSVRTYRVVNKKKVYSSWSAVKKIKVKK